MPARAARFPIARTLVCVILGVGFLCFGNRDRFHRSKLGPALPFYSTDQYLGLAVRGWGGSERVLQAIAKANGGKPIAVVYPETNASLAFPVMYLAWPIPVQNVRLSGDVASYDFESLRSPDLGAVVFCNIEPPADFPPAIRVGEGLIVVPLNATAAEVRP